MQTAELVAMPLADRLQAMEALWNSLCRDTSAMPTIPAWHEEILGKRLTALESGSDAQIPWEEAKMRIRKQAEQFVNQRNEGRTERSRFGDADSMSTQTIAESTSGTGKGETGAS